jgi:hypothetical protein
MKQEKIIGYLLIAGAIGVFIPYTILTITFEYPDILRQDAGTILTRFHNGGSSLIFTWWAFAILGLPLLIAYILIGQMFENKVGFIRWTTTIGVVSGMVQIIGLLRWVFVVPVIANTYATSDGPATREAARVRWPTYSLSLASGAVYTAHALPAYNSARRLLHRAAARAGRIRSARSSAPCEFAA